jgi:phage gp46-like protein
MTDVLLRQTNDGGDIIAEAGLLRMSEGLETAAFLSMFGGNELDAGDTDSTEQWWGNIGETEAARTYRSETQFLIKSLPTIPANLLRIEQAGARDLAWMVEAGVAKSVAVSARIPALNSVAVDVTIDTLLREVTFTFG